MIPPALKSPRKLQHYPDLDGFARDSRYEVAAHRMPQQPTQERHGHGFLEIVIVESGSALHVTEGESHRATRGDILVLNPSRTHAYRDAEDFSLVNILVLEAFIRKLEPELGVLAGFHTLFNLRPFQLENGSYPSRLRLPENELDPILRYAAEIESTCKSKSAEGPVLCHAWTRLLIASLAARGGAHPEADSHNAFAQALARVEQSIVEPLSLDAIVALSGMSERTFLRRFREATGHSPMQHQLRCRLRHACHLLLDTDLNITEIAMSCGFQDSNYFTRQFSRLHGMSPRNWRRAMG